MKKEKKKIQKIMRVKIIVKCNYSRYYCKKIFPKSTKNVHKTRNFKKKKKKM